MLVDYELRRSLRLSLLSFTDLSLRRCSDIPDRISNSHICVQRTSWENTSLEANLLFFPTLITWGHLWKSRCFQRPCTSYLRFQKVSVNIVRHFPWGFSITINSGKVNFWLCLAGSKIITKTCLISEKYPRRNVLFLIQTGSIFKVTAEN